MDIDSRPVRKKNYAQVERELWMLSGNECAFEGCRNRMVTESGAYVGEIAHICGVGRTSARHDPTMSDDDLRDKSNLILLCHEHHVETDDVLRYPVERMRQMKERHEARFRKAYAEFEAQFKDYTDELSPVHCRMLRRWEEVLNWHGENISEAYVQSDIEALNTLADRLSKLTDAARSAFAFVVERGVEDSWHNSFSFSLDEMARRTRTTRQSIIDVFEELKRCEFGHIHSDEYEPEPPEAIVYAPTEDQRYHSEYLIGIRSYCQQTAIDVGEVLVELKFNLLDD